MLDDRIVLAPILTKRKKTTKNVERPKTPCLGKIPTQATAMFMTQVKYLTLTSTPKGSTIYEYPSHHESYAVPPPPPGHSFRPYTEKELPFPVINMAVAWVGILPRQGVLGRSTFFVVFFLFVKIFDVLIVVITIICQIIHK
jgi:hypothetical protein